MIDAILTFLGISNNYYIFAVLIAGCIVTMILMEFLFIFSFIFRKIGGIK